MPRIILFHWDGREGAERCARLHAEGIDASMHPRTARLSYLRENPPDAFVIDLMRLPSAGRWLAAEIRSRKSLDALPLVFIEGDPAKTPALRKEFPRAVITSWARIGSALERLKDAKPPASAAPALWNRPLAAKLRIREGIEVALVGAPENVKAMLGPMPKGVRFQKKIGEAEVTLVFARSVPALARELPGLAAEARPGRTLWIFWPKRASKAGSGLSMPLIREMAFPLGLVDYKVCSLDDTWSGMVLAQRRTKRGAKR